MTIEVTSRFKMTAETFDEAFASVGETVRQDPFRQGFVGPEMSRQFLRANLPAPREFWIAKYGTQVNGRIGANVSPEHEETGYVGFFEVDVDSPDAERIAHKLLDEACGWLASQGVTRVVGPMNFSLWFSYRFALPNGDGQQFLWEPVNPPDYPGFFEAEGFSVAEKYHSMGFSGLESFVGMMKPAYDKAIAKGYTFRPWDSDHLLDKEVPILYKVGINGFADSSPLYEPIDENSFKQLYVPIAKKFDGELSQFVIDPEGNEVGFLFAFAMDGHYVLKTLTVADNARGLGLSNAMTYLGAKKAVERGIGKFVTALVREGQQSESLTKKCPEIWKHDYALFEKRL